MRCLFGVFDCVFTWRLLGCWFGLMVWVVCVVFGFCGLLVGLFGVAIYVLCLIIVLVWMQ